MGRHGRCHHPAGAHHALCGKGNDGAFRTAIAKIYPPALNRAVACAIIQAALSYRALRELVEPLSKDLEALLSFDFDHLEEVQPDFYAKG